MEAAPHRGFSLGVLGVFHINLCVCWCVIPCYSHPLWAYVQHGIKASANSWWVLCRCVVCRTSPTVLGLLSFGALAVCTTTRMSSLVQRASITTSGVQEQFFVVVVIRRSKVQHLRHCSVQHLQKIQCRLAGYSVQRPGDRRLGCCFVQSLQSFSATWLAILSSDLVTSLLLIYSCVGRLRFNYSCFVNFFWPRFLVCFLRVHQAGSFSSNCLLIIWLLSQFLSVHCF